MTHHMKLNPQPFDMIASGSKTIELRLNDEKRQQIQIGDRIMFSKTTEPDVQILTEVVCLHRFPDFDQLYCALPLDKCGYLPEEVAAASPGDMEAYYSTEAQAQYGVLGIELKLI